MKNRGKLFGGAAFACALTASAFVAVDASATTPSGSVASDLHALELASASAPAVAATASAGPAKVLSDIAKPGEIGTQTLIRDPSYWVYNAEYDSPVDSDAYPELGSSALAVSKASPTLMTIAGLGSPSSDGNVSAGNGYVAVLLDTNNDGDADFGTITPTVYMYTSSAYSASVFRFSGGNLIDTGVDATWVRTSSGWGTALPWKALGISGARHIMAIKDDYGDYDYSPNIFGTYARLAGVVAPPKSAQKPAATVPTRIAAKVGKQITLSAKTNAGRAITWKTRTPRLCLFASNKLVLTGRKGSCGITATATGNATYLALNKNYAISLV